MAGRQDAWAILTLLTAALFIRLIREKYRKGVLLFLLTGNLQGALVILCRAGALLQKVPQMYL
nr:MAG TPA: hypothetical protein [Caudoviricetes sp.]